MRISMRDIAKETGVSIATVSRALAADPRVRPATRVRVLKAAEKLGYEHDPALGVLNAYREGRRRNSYRQTIAWLTNFPTPEGWREVATSVSYFEEIKRLAAPRGYLLEPFWLHPDQMPVKRLHHILRSRAIQGIFLPSLPAGSHRIDFPWENYCVVSLSETVHHPRTHSVQKSTFFDIRTIVSRLAELGFRRPVFAAHTRYYQGLGGVLEGAFYAATMEFMHRKRPVRHAPRDTFNVEIHKIIAETNADCVVSSLFPPGDLGTFPWALVSGDPARSAELAGTLHHEQVIAKAGLDLMTGLLQRAEVGLPEHPLVVRVQGVWSDGKLRTVQKGESRRRVRGL